VKPPQSSVHERSDGTRTLVYGSVGDVGSTPRGDCGGICSPFRHAPFTTGRLGRHRLAQLAPVEEVHSPKVAAASICRGHLGVRLVECSYRLLDFRELTFNCRDA
jgi:hypothetical protein